MTKELAIVLALTFGATELSLAQAFDEQAAQRACRDDAFRYCQNFIPDRERTLACLLSSRDGLSEACRTVLARYFKPEPRTRTQRKRLQDRAGTPPNPAR